ncbi:MAG: hypothetical protein GY749_35705 [Desulfobacteraceae bacterium]|nr:hypothetical protein [Desulfobacteraceae bacterium]
MNFYTSRYHAVKATVLTILVSLLFSFPVIAGELSPDNIKFNKSDNTISVNIIKKDISDVAGTLSKETGIRIFLDESVTRTITSKFNNIPLESGIKRILGPDISSAFVFVEENSPSGETGFRLDTVKIFNSGNMLSANFKIFDKAAKISQASVLKKYMPGTPGAIRYEIMKARKNLDILRRKHKAETGHAKSKVASIKMKMSKKFSSPDEREKLVKSLIRSRQKLTALMSSNSRIMMDEENNLRELVEEKEKMESRKKFAERQRETEKQAEK